MKKILLAFTVFFTLSIGTLFAAPINDLYTGQTAIGAGSDTFYIENKLTDNFTLGYQNVDLDHYGNSDDVYGQLHFTDNLRGIIGNRSFDSNSKMYLGMAVNTPLAPNSTGYASLIAGNSFKEVQVGANVNLAPNVDLNLNYHSFIPDEGHNSNGVGVGATLKF